MRSAASCCVESWTASSPRRCSGCPALRPASPTRARRGAAANEVQVLPAAATAPSAAAQAEPAARLAVVYGSQTGNGRRIAERLGRAAEAAGLAVRVYAARDYPLRDLAQERLLTVVMSTHGDGDPPDDARGFLEHLAGTARAAAAAAQVRGARARRLELPEVLRDGPAGGRAAGGARGAAADRPRGLRRGLRARSPLRGRNAW